MAHFEVELDAFNSCPDVGDACGLSAAQVFYGLGRMWVYVFRTEQDVLDAVQIQGFMCGNERAARALVVFGFLEKQDGDLYRVKGADRLLGQKRAKRAGGLAARKNLVPGAYQKKLKGEKQVSESRGAAQEPPSSASSAGSSAGPGLEPGLVLGFLPHYLTTSLPTTVKETAAAAENAAPPPKRRRKETGETKTPNPRVATLNGLLFEAYQEITGVPYDFQGRDWPALTRLAQGKSTDEEIVRRWRRAWTSSGFDKPTDIHDFAAKWNRYGTGPPRQVDFSRGSIRAQDVPREQHAETGDITHRL